jgi:hypothetical protein
LLKILNLLKKLGLGEVLTVNSKYEKFFHEKLTILVLVSSNNNDLVDEPL